MLPAALLSVGNMDEITTEVDVDLAVRNSTATTVNASAPTNVRASAPTSVRVETGPVTGAGGSASASASVMNSPAPFVIVNSGGAGSEFLK